MRRTTVSTDIAAPPSRVWEVMSDVDHWAEWTPSVTSVQRLGDKPFAVGTRVRIRQPGLPAAVWTIASVVPEASFTWVSRTPGLEVTAEHLIEPVNGGSRVTLALTFDGILGNVWERLTRGVTQRYIAAESSGLKARSEDPSFRVARSGG